MSNQTPQDRYHNDPAYHRMVDLMTSMILAHEFTPSEMREMAVMASMHFEMKYGLRHYLQSVPHKVNEAFKQLEKFRETSENERKKMEEKQRIQDRKDAEKIRKLEEE